MSKLNKKLPKPGYPCWMDKNRNNRKYTIEMPFKGVIPDGSCYIGWRQNNYTYSYQPQYWVEARLVPSKQLGTGSTTSKTKWKWMNKDWKTDPAKPDTRNGGAAVDKKNRYYRYVSFKGLSLMTKGSYDRLILHTRVRSYNPKTKQHGYWTYKDIYINCKPTISVHKVVATADGGFLLFLDTNGWTRGNSQVVLGTVKHDDTAELAALAAANETLAEKESARAEAYAYMNEKFVERDTAYRLLSDAKDYLAAKQADLEAAQAAFDSLPEGATQEDIDAAQAALDAANASVTEAQTEVENAQATADGLKQPVLDACDAYNAANAEYVSALEVKNAAQAEADKYPKLNSNTITLTMSAPGQEEDASYPYVTVPGSSLSSGFLPSEDIKFTDCYLKTCDGVKAYFDCVKTIDSVSAIIDRPNITVTLDEGTGIITTLLTKSDPDDDWDAGATAWMECSVDGELVRVDPVHVTASTENWRKYWFIPPLDADMKLTFNIGNDLGCSATFEYTKNDHPTLGGIPSNNRILINYSDGSETQPKNGTYYASKAVAMVYDTDVSTDSSREVETFAPLGRTSPFAVFAEGIKNTISVKGSIGNTYDGWFEPVPLSGYKDWLDFQKHQGLCIIRRPGGSMMYAACTKLAFSQGEASDETKTVDMSFMEVSL